MICPKCGSDTSGLVLRCESCGHLLVSRESPAGPDEHGSPLEDVPAGGSVPYAGLPPSEVPRMIPYIEAPREGVFRAAAPSPGKATPWYYKPWPYVVGIAVALAVVASLFAFRGSVKAYPELVVDNLPTLLDFYTDT